MTTVRLHDTLSREIRPLEPADGKTYRMYCCGPTVYGPAHIGNFRTFILQDLLRRTLEASGLMTRHVRNITDIDDKTIRQSQAEGKTLHEFTGYWLDQFHRDCEALNLLPPHVEPSAVEHIPQQIKLVEKLIEREHAYVAPDGSVYFRVETFPAYGRLSRLPEREITTSNRPPPCACVQDDDEYDRESAVDFALWKSHKPDDGPNQWTSPWGPGRPGWHLECSAMSLEYLGDDFDLHGGGVDLIFPHHENEIAQSEAATDRPFARHWFHSAHLLADGRKMSKSLNNLYVLKDIVRRGHTPMELRYVLASGHYRQTLNFTWDSLNAARSALRRLQQLQSDLMKASDGKKSADASWGSFANVWTAMADDLNTPKALGELFVTVHELESRLHARALDADAAATEWQALRRIFDLFGFRIETKSVEEPPEIRKLAEERLEARRAGNWSRADTLREEIETRGWTVRDVQDGFELIPND